MGSPVSEAWKVPPVVFGVAFEMLAQVRPSQLQQRERVCSVGDVCFTCV